jgi:hypothetical protein
MRVVAVDLKGAFMSRTTVETALAAIDRDIVGIDRTIANFPWSNPRAYAHWLAQTYFYTRHASRVSAHAAMRTPVTRIDLHDHFVRTINEEKDHPPMVIDDLRELGFSIEDFREHPLTGAFYQTLHYQIDTVGPFALIGYFFVIEGYASRYGKELLHKVRTSHGGKGLSFLEEHVIADAVHYPKAQAFVASLADDELAVVARCGTLAASIYSHMVRALVDDISAA